MKYFESDINDVYYKEGILFNKYSEKNILKYAVAANLYMNSLMDIYDKIILKKLEGVACITICFEDSIKESQVSMAQENVFLQLNKLSKAIKSGILDLNDVPLIFIRVRSMEQFIEFTRKLLKEEAQCLCGFVFPKFDQNNAYDYLSHTKYLSEKFDNKFYVMPILESENIIYKEHRVTSLVNIRNILKKYDDMILNIRVGGTDFSSKFGLRRSVCTSIYDIRVVCDCLIDIINFFSREDTNYIVSAPVFEYFNNNYDSKEVKGLLDEIKLDIENGFFGKTAIHPNQINYIKRSCIVNYENFIDAKRIIESAKMETGGVFKGENNNKMNEVSPHTNWAKKILERSKVFGVLKKEIEDINLVYRGMNFED